MTKITDTAAYATAIATVLADLQKLTAVELRKVAGKGFGIKGASKGRKDALIAQIMEIEAQRIEAEMTEAAAKADKPAKKAPAKSNKCHDCGTRKIDPRTQGRDSTLCRACFEYAGQVNEHNDEDHEGTGGRLDCQVCLDNDPSAIKIAHPKAAQFANAAKAAGWEVEVKATDAKVNEVRKATFTVIAKGDSEEISLSWDSGLYDYDASNYIDPKGCRKVRNTSAAIQIIQASAAKAEAK